MNTSAEKGFILPTVLIITAVLMIIGFALLSAVTGNYAISVDDMYSDNALQAAEAGVEQSIDQLNQSDSFAGYPTAQTLFNNTTQGYGTFVTTIADATDGSNAKTITSTGTVYHYGQTTNPVSTKEVRVTVVGTQATGFSVLTGPGGLQLSGGTSIISGTVYANGPIDLSGGSSIGTSKTALNVFSANDQCPAGSSPGASYPEVCSDGTQPLSVPNGTNIYGSVCATGQTTSTNISDGNGGEGLEPGCVAAVQPMISYNRAAQISAVTTTVASSNAIANGCDSWTSPNGFARTWPANLEITGNVTLDSSCDLTVDGDVYITGNLNISGGMDFNVANSLGTTRPVIIVDGTITVTGGPTLIPNSDGSAPDFYSFDSTASCGATCTSLSGNDLKTSSDTTTVSLSGGAKWPGASFDAYWGEADLSGGSSAGAVAGQTVVLDGAGSITFGTVLGSGTQTWTISSYQIIPVNSS